MSETKNKPEIKFTAGGITSAVWKNENKDADGKSYSFYTVTVERVYKDQKGDWQSTQTLRPNDIPKANLVLLKAYEYLMIKVVAEE